MVGQSGGEISGTLSTFGFSLPDEIATTRVDTFKKAYPKVQVKITEGGFDEQFLSAVASGSPPDLVYVDREIIGAYAARGAIQPLDDCVSSAKIDMSQYRPAAVQQVTVDGKVYGIPEFYSVRVMMINNQAVKEGLINGMLGLVGIQGPAWTTDPAWIKPGIALMSLWTLGSTTIIYLAALNNVPRELYEAARLDGASPWRQFRHVTVPMISGALFFTLIVNTIASLQLFAEVYTMYFGNRAIQSSTSDAALFYVVYLFQHAFQFLHMASPRPWPGCCS